MQSENVNVPSVARLSRVRDVLSTDPKYASLVKDPDIPVSKRDGTSVNFTRDVIQIASEIRDMGKDACTCTRPMILDQADQHLATSTGAAVKRNENTKMLPPNQVEHSVAASNNHDSEDNSGLSCNFAIFSLLSMALNLEKTHGDENGSPERQKALESAVSVYRVLLP